MEDFGLCGMMNCFCGRGSKLSSSGQGPVVGCIDGGKFLDRMSDVIL